MEATCLTGSLVFGKLAVLVILLVGSMPSTSSLSVPASDNSSNNAENLVNSASNSVVQTSSAAAHPKYVPAEMFFHQTSDSSLVVDIREPWALPMEAQQVDGNGSHATHHHHHHVPQEVCPHIRTPEYDSECLHKFRVDVQVNERQCILRRIVKDGKLRYEMTPDEPLPARRNVLIPNIESTFSQGIDIRISAEVDDDDGNREQQHVRPPFKSYGDEEGNCPGINLDQCGAMTIKIVVDNSREHPPFRGLNLDREVDQTKSFTINTGECPLPSIRMNLCNRIKIRIHTKLPDYETYRSWFEGNSTGQLEYNSRGDYIMARPTRRN